MAPEVETHCRLMQDFVAIRPVDAKSDLRAIRVQNKPLVFSMGTDHTLYLIYQDDAHTTEGWTRLPLLGLGEEEEVTAFGVAQDPTYTDRFRIAAAFRRSDGRNVLMISRLVDFEAVDWQQQSAVDAIWNSVSLPDPYATGNEVRVDPTGNVLITTTKPPSPAKYYLYDPDRLRLSAFGLPEAGAKIISLSLGSLWGERGIYLLYDLGRRARTLLFQSFVDPEFGTTFKQRFDIDGQVHDFFVVPDVDGYDSVYTCGDSVCHFPDPTEREVIVRGGDTTYTQIRAVQEDSKITLWLKGSAGTSSGLYYVTNQFSSGGVSTLTKWTAPLLMAKDVGQFACERETYISNHLFLINNSNTLLHLYQDKETTLWREEPIYLEDVAEAHEITTYVVTARFSGLPEDKATRVKVSATSSIYASVNETSVLIGPRKSVWIELREDPEISVSIPVEDLSVPNIVFSADCLPEGSIEVDCTETVLEDLGKYKTGTDLKNAKTEDGTPVFSNRSELPNDATLDAVAATTHRLAEHAKAMKAEKGKGRSFQRPVPANGTRNSENVMNLSMSDHDLSLKTYQASTKHQSPLRRPRGLFSGIGSAFGDVIHSLSKGFAVLKSFVVDASTGVLKVALHLSSGVVDFVVKTFEQVVGLIKPLLNLAKIGWDKLKKLVSFIFNFHDIKKTKGMLVDYVNGSFDIIRKNVRFLKTRMNMFADDAKEYLGASQLNDQIRAAVGDKTLHEQKAKAQEGDSAGGKEWKSSEANWMSRKLRQVARTPSGGMETEEGKEGGLVKSVVNLFTGAWEQLKFLGSRLADLVRELLTGKISIATFVLELLKAAGAILIDTAQNVGNVILDLFDKIVDVVRFALNKRIRIPIIWTLAKKFLGVNLEFSLLDILAFIAAVPTTITYKVITGRAPHHDLTSSAVLNALDQASLDDRRGKPPNDPEHEHSPHPNPDTEGCIGIIGGIIGVLRSVTLGIACAMCNVVPYSFKFLDIGLGLMTSLFSLTLLGFKAAGLGRDEAIVMQTFVTVILVYNVFEIRYMLIRNPWPGFIMLTGLGVVALVRWGAFTGSFNDVKTVTLSLYGVLSWLLAAPHRIIQETPAAPLAVVSAGMRGVFELTRSGLLVDNGGKLL